MEMNGERNKVVDPEYNGFVVLIVDVVVVVVVMIST